MRFLISIFFIFTVLPALAAEPKSSVSIAPQHQTCQNDDQCALVVTGCSCVCGDSHVSAVNKAYAPLYTGLSHCSTEQYTACQTSTCNPPFLDQQAECLHSVCAPKKLKLPPTKPKD